MTPSPAEGQTDWPLFVISLAGDRARRARITAHLDGMGLPFTFIDAVDGRGPDRNWPADQVDAAGAEAHLGRPLTGPEIGCALSHQRVYARILHEGLPGAIVLEDDAELLPAAAEFLRRRGYALAPLIQLHYVDCRVFRLGRGPLMPGHRLARVATHSASTVAYTVRSDAARHLHEAGLPLTGPADWPCDTTRIGHAVVLPMLARHADQGGQVSHIEGQRAAAQAIKARPAPGRFFRAPYWRRWLRKRLSVRIA